MTTASRTYYVFKPEYSLMPLFDQETIIQENGHLPAIPTEADVLENGVNLLEMNVKLLEKIEELNLYILYQSKEIETI